MVTLPQQRSQNRLPDFWDAFRRMVHICWLASLALVAIALWLWGAVEVRGHGGEVFPLTFLGCVWLLISYAIFPWLGLSARDDVIERKNPTALVAYCSACVAVAITYAGGSLGEGPSYWNNIFSAALGTSGLLALWVLLELGGNISASITEERDLASGIRFGGFLLAAGLILGRAVAGNWHSESETVHDFLRDGWPAAALVVMATSIERLVRPSRTRPFPAWRTCGLLPAMVYLAFATAWLCHLGRWEGMPK